MDEHRRGLAQATHRLCRVLGGKGQGPHPRGRPHAGTTAVGAGIGAARAPGAAEAGLLSAFAPCKDPALRTGSQPGSSVMFQCVRTTRKKSETPALREFACLP